MSKAYHDCPKPEPHPTRLRLRTRPPRRLVELAAELLRRKPPAARAPARLELAAAIAVDMDDYDPRDPRPGEAAFSELAEQLLFERVAGQ